MKRRKLDAKKLYWGSLDHFKNRNLAILPQIQLQYGKCEIWLAREFSLAMNTQLSGEVGARNLPTYAACEVQKADITVWRPALDENELLAHYEVKAFSNRNDNVEAMAKKARSQLEASKLDLAENRIGLFFSVFSAKKNDWSQRDVSAFKGKVRKAVLDAGFTSDHKIRMTELVQQTDGEVNYGSDPWRTASWITWGRLPSPKS